jgi:hypothetical protein
LSCFVLKQQDPVQHDLQIWLHPYIRRNVWSLLVITSSWEKTLWIIVIFTIVGYYPSIYCMLDIHDKYKTNAFNIFIYLFMQWNWRHECTWFHDIY